MHALDCILALCGMLCSAAVGLAALQAPITNIRAVLFTVSTLAALAAARLVTLSIGGH